LALEKLNVGGRSWAVNWLPLAEKTDRRLYEKESYQEARDAEPGLAESGLK